MLSQDTPIYHWYASSDGELFTVGPCDSREEVIELAVEEELGAYEDETGAWRLGFEILEASRTTVDISRHLPTGLIGSLLGERIDEEHGCEDDVSPSLDAWNAEQQEDLARSLRLAVRQWQFRNGIVITPALFGAKRSREDIDIPIPPSNP